MRPDHGDRRHDRRPSIYIVPPPVLIQETNNYTITTATPAWVPRQGYGMSTDSQARLGEQSLNAGNYRDARMYLDAAARNGHPGALRNLGILYENGYGVTQDQESAVKLFQQAAQRGDAVAQYRLGLYCESGWELEKPNQQYAAAWFAAASKQGYAPAQSRLGQYYQYGYGGLTQDYAAAAALFERASAQGDVIAMSSLGAMYEYGYGVARDRRRAEALLLRAADANEPNAQFYLGLIRESSGDVRKAAEWYQISARNGCAQAYTRLGELFYSGIGSIPKNRGQAFELFKKGAELGDPDATEALRRYDRR